MKHRYISGRERVSARRVRKLYLYSRNAQSLQGQLTERAILIAARKGVEFHGDCALWLRELVERTAANVMQVPPEGLAFDSEVVRRINLAFAAVDRLVEEIVFQVKAGATLSVIALRDALERLCPAAPIC